jgi:hypothetical protein
MNLGDIFYWVTSKAIGHNSRPKYHIYICRPDWVDDHTFLFINKGMYGEDFKITKKEYPFLAYGESYISCNAVISYSDTELSSFAKAPIGKLLKSHLRALSHKIADSKTMELQQIKRICEALRSI